jgi:hypothetical protein
MRAQEFRRIALGLTDAIEGSHMGHPDFRVNGRIFATLHPDNKFGMVKLPPDQQQRFVDENPDAFAPESGAWGRQGCTRVRLDTVDEDTLGEAMTIAWQATKSLKSQATKSLKSKVRSRKRRKV